MSRDLAPRAALLQPQDERYRLLGRNRSEGLANELGLTGVRRWRWCAHCLEWEKQEAPLSPLTIDNLVRDDSIQPRPVPTGICWRARRAHGTHERLLQNLAGLVVARAQSTGIPQ
jgi:hypothetical protein